MRVLHYIDWLMDGKVLLASHPLSPCGCCWYQTKETDISLWVQETLNHAKNAIPTSFFLLPPPPPTPPKRETGGNVPLHVNDKIMGLGSPFACSLQWRPGRCKGRSSCEGGVHNWICCFASGEKTTSMNFIKDVATSFAKEVFLGYYLNNQVTSYRELYSVAFSVN